MLLILSIILIFLIMCLKNRKLRKRLSEVGSSVSTSYLLYVNNENPMSFDSKHQVFSYLKRFREENVIFKLQIYRIETYSL